jgi:prolyl-tRNA synthetase
MKSELISGTANGIYEELRKAGVEVLFDDRSEVSAGVKFNDADLLGMPVQVIIGEKKFKTGQVEFKIRATQERKDIPLEEVVKECVNFEF